MTATLNKNGIIYKLNKDGEPDDIVGYYHCSEAKMERDYTSEDIENLLAHEPDEVPPEEDDTPDMFTEIAERMDKATREFLAEDTDLIIEPLRAYPDSLNPNPLPEADQLVSGQRQADYDSPSNNFKRIGIIWGVLIEGMAKSTGWQIGDPVPPATVGLMMAGLKLARECFRPKWDNLVDAAGYIKTVWMIVTGQNPDERAEGER
jgi:hypothetical protein